MKTHWAALYQRFTGAFLISRIVGSVTENFASDAMATEIEQFFAACAPEVRMHAAMATYTDWAAHPERPQRGIDRNGCNFPQEAAAVDRTLKQSLERIRANHRWLERDHAAVASWLREHVQHA